MKPALTKKQAQAFRDRWRKVNEAEIEELRRTSPDRKFKQLAALMASVKAFGWEKSLREGEEEVRKRWIRLYKAFCG